MTDKRSLHRHIATSLVRHMLAETEGNRRDWALGMAAEVEAIDADWPALRFALGCWWSLCGLTMISRVLTPVLGVCLLGWAGVKLYFAVLVSGLTETVASLPNWLVPVVLLAGAVYALGGVCVLRRRYGLAASVLGSVMLVNAGVYMIGLYAGPSPNAFMIALAFEDYIIWSLALFGLGGALWLSHVEEAQAL